MNTTSSDWSLFIVHTNYITRTLGLFNVFFPPLFPPPFPGWIFSGRTRGGLRLLPPAVLAGRAHRGSGGDRHLTHLRVLCLPVLSPRLRLTVTGLLRCSQVSYEVLNQPPRPAFLFTVKRRITVTVVVNEGVWVRFNMCTDFYAKESVQNIYCVINMQYVIPLLQRRILWPLIIFLLSSFSLPFLIICPLYNLRSLLIFSAPPKFLSFRRPLHLNCHRTACCF